MRRLAGTASGRKVFINDDLQDEIPIHDLPSSFDSLVDLALRVEIRLEICSARVQWRSTLSPLEVTRRGPEPHPEPEPIQVGRMHLSAEEIQRHIALGLCLYCGKPGHFAAQCPLKVRNRQ